MPHCVFHRIGIRGLTNYMGLTYPRVGYIISLYIENTNAFLPMSGVLKRVWAYGKAH